MKPDSWYSLPQLLGAFKILVLYALFALALLGVGLMVQAIEGSKDTYIDSDPY